MRFLLFHALERNAGDFRNDVHHVVRCHHYFFLFALLTPFAQNCFELFLGLFFSVAKRGGLFEVLRFNRRLLFKANLFDFLLYLLDIGRPRHGVDARACAGFIHYIDRFIGEKASGNITVGKSDCCLERFVGKFRLVMGLVFRAQTFQDLDGFIDGWRIDLYGLETALERCVFLDVLAVLVHRGRADALQFAPAQRGLDDVRSVHRALGRTRTHDRVQLVDEKDHFLGTTNLVHHRLDTLFKLAAVFCSGHH